MTCVLLLLGVSIAYAILIGIVIIGLVLGAPRRDDEADR